MNPVKKVKLLFLIEYLLIAALFIVLGTLFLAEVIKVAEWKRYAFTYVTLFGGAWIIIDFFWCMFSTSRRTKISMIDKWLLLPVGVALLSFDIYAIINGCAEALPYRWVIGIDLVYLGVVYVFQAIYHWYRPIPALLEAALADEERKKEEEQPKSIPSAEELKNPDESEPK